jgi:uncharacterized protein YndB with AHSA1/START domain
MRIEAKRAIDGDADTVFDLVSDPTRLNTWNRAIRGTIEAPAVLVVGSQWIVQLGVLGQSWRSRSTVVDLDRDARRIAYRSQTDDGNPSFADWSWKVDPASSGCVVEVSVELHPATFWRRVLLARVRACQLRRGELPDSLEQLARAVQGSATR